MTSNWATPVVGGICPTAGAGYRYLCPCAPGTYGTSTNAAAQSDCTTCPPSFWCAGGSGALSGTCARGYYCPPGSYNASSVPCPAGSFNAFTNASEAAHCSDCGLGNYCPAGSSSPTPCPAGTFANTTRVGSAATCTQCPAGSRCPQGSAAPVPCGIGFHSAAGATLCTICPGGRYCPLNTTSTAGLSAFVCPAGTLCFPGMDNEPDLTSQACPAGGYCPAGTLAQIGCPAGTYQPFRGAASAAACVTCPAGSWCAANATAPTGVCSSGYYCPAGSVNSTAVACNPSTFRGATGGAVASDCAWCPSGFFCPTRATVTPVTCTAGNYWCVMHLPTRALCQTTRVLHFPELRARSHSVSSLLLASCLSSSPHLQPDCCISASAVPDWNILQYERHDFQL